eukprot:3775612-Prorocentrum_lima.AAC.1
MFCFSRCVFGLRVGLVWGWWVDPYLFCVLVSDVWVWGVFGIASGIMCGNGHPSESLPRCALMRSACCAVFLCCESTFWWFVGCLRCVAAPCVSGGGGVHAAGGA